MTDNLFDLTGKIAVVTGASRGLGQYLGRALARAGADLVITSRSMPDLKQFQAEIEGMGRQVLPLELDLRDAASIRAAADAASSHFGKIFGAFQDQAMLARQNQSTPLVIKVGT